MKREPNNEMDLFLRKLGRESKTTPVIEGDGTSDAATEKHLDADELNAYAENALPASTRARYTAHLADCTRCRKIVSQLTLAAGVMIEKTPAAALAPSGLKAFLSSLFSPMVLRYAVPAVTLIAFASIAFFVFRSPTYLARRSPDVATQVAQNQPEAAPTFQNKTFSETRTKGATGEETENKAKAPREEAADSKVERQKTEEPKPQPTAVDHISAANAPASSNAAPPAAAETVTVQEQPTVSREVAQRKGGEPPTSTTASADATTSDTALTKAPAKLAKEKESQKSANRSFSMGGAAGVANTKNEVNAARSRAAERDEPINGRRDEDKVSKDSEKADKNEMETRSVAGRRFRKEGSIWVDTAFDSSRRTVNLARGSEQYRALVADEPEIKTIAEQLSGEVVVVWKGTAYRIR